MGNRDVSPSWSRDGDQIVFARLGPNGYDLYRKPSSGAGNEEVLRVSDRADYPTSWSSDGTLLYQSLDANGTWSLWTLPPPPNTQSQVFTSARSPTGGARFSPDGHWVAYHSSQSGRYEIYVAPFPATGARWQISTAGGTWPRWRGDGKEIYYQSPDNKVMAAAVDVDRGAIALGKVEALFDSRFASPRFDVGFSYDASSDGRRFLIPSVVESSSVPITVVVNWPALLK